MSRRGEYFRRLKQDRDRRSVVIGPKEITAQVIGKSPKGSRLVHTFFSSSGSKRSPTVTAWSLKWSAISANRHPFP